jgi:hypothetical protein
MAMPFPRLPHPHLGGRSLLRNALICPPKRQLQPERYVKYGLELVGKYIKILYIDIF